MLLVKFFTDHISAEPFSEEERRQAPDVRSWASDVALSVIVQGTDPSECGALLR